MCAMTAAADPQSSTLSPAWQDVMFGLEIDDVWLIVVTSGGAAVEGSQSQHLDSVSSDKSVVGHVNEYEDEKERLLRKIELVGEKIKVAVKSKEADVEEFLRLTSSVSVVAPDNPQMMRVRQMFDKKNKKSTQTINSLQKKLENYRKRLKDLNEGVLHRGITETMLSNMGQGLKDVGTNIKESLSEYTGSVMSVPKDIALKLRKSKFGSTDFIPASGDEVSYQKKVGSSPGKAPDQKCTFYNSER
ncbi:unnamed protein product [Soboliphyme baturini]|uniref:SynN domain-containing protein n=1 Tax=Soboliphyme baturini TaxID=241478 RepID=A0A183II52_9BILA|nr:unnamed protein product [Soboliphyme baturini]